MRVATKLPVGGFVGALGAAMEVVMSDPLLEALGVTLPPPKAHGATVECGQAAPRLVRHTEWSNATSFTFGGYLARVRRRRCETCDSVTEIFEGIFTEEISPSGARRLQALDRRAQWPAGEEHRCEVLYDTSRLCAGCVRGLGFGQEVVNPHGREIVIGDTV